MERLLILIVTLFFLSACTSSGYHRPYIITDTTDEEVISEPGETR